MSNSIIESFKSGSYNLYQGMCVLIAVCWMNFGKLNQNYYTTLF